jgi:hypothetical protein
VGQHALLLALLLVLARVNAFHMRTLLIGKKKQHEHSRPSPHNTIITVAFPLPIFIYLKEQDRDPEDDVHVRGQDVSDNRLVVHGGADQRQGRAHVLGVAHVLVRAVRHGRIKQEPEAVAVVHALDPERLKKKKKKVRTYKSSVCLSLQFDPIFVFFVSYLQSPEVQESSSDEAESSEGSGDGGREEDKL